MINFVEVLGLVAGFCSTVSSVPQIMKIYKTHSAKDLSLITYMLVALAALLWLIYGILVHSIALIITNSISLILQIAIMIMIFRLKK